MSTTLNKLKQKVKEHNADTSQLVNVEEILKDFDTTKILDELESTMINSESKTEDISHV